MLQSYNAHPVIPSVNLAYEVVVDGCDYDVFVTFNMGTESIEVFDALSEIVGYATVTDDSFLDITYVFEDESEVKTIFPANEYISAHELARWIVSTHPYNG